MFLIVEGLGTLKIRKCRKLPKFGNFRHETDQNLRQVFTNMFDTDTVSAGLKRFCAATNFFLSFWLDECNTFLELCWNTRLSGLIAKKSVFWTFRGLG